MHGHSRSPLAHVRLDCNGVAVTAENPENQYAWHAHRRYLSTGALRPELLREPVFRAWERCHAQGTSARQARAVHLADAEIERLLTQQRGFMVAARPYLQALSQAAAAERHAAMLGDSRGVVLDVIGDPQSVCGPERVPSPGSLLSEAVSGANGIGTPLAEGGYIELVGAEHFIEGFHLFTCQGVPIRTPDGAIAGIISISMRRTEAARRLHELLVCAAHGIEAELIRERLDEDVRRLIAAGGRDDEPLLENLRQDLVQAQATARLEVALAARDLARDRLAYAARLLALAQRSIAIFERQSALWRDLAATDPGPLRVVDLAVLLANLAALLQTEAATVEVTVEVVEGEPLSVVVDPLQLSRALLRAFLRAFEAARGGGTARASTQRRADGHAVVLVHASPPPLRQADTRSWSVPAGQVSQEPG